MVMKKITLNNVVWREGKYYVSKCLDNNVSSFGKTKKEALANLQEALELYFEDEDTSSANIMNLIQPMKNPEMVRSVFSFKPKYAKVLAK